METCGDNGSSFFSTSSLFLPSTCAHDVPVTRVTATVLPCANREKGQVCPLRSLTVDTTVPGRPAGSTGLAPLACGRRDQRRRGRSIQSSGSASSPGGTRVTACMRPAHNACRRGCVLPPCLCLLLGIRSSPLPHRSFARRGAALHSLCRARAQIHRESRRIQALKREHCGAGRFVDKNGDELSITECGGDLSFFGDVIGDELLASL